MSLLYKLAGLIHLVSVVKRVVHEPGDERGFAHRLLAEKNQFKLSQRVTEVTRGRHSEWLFIFYVTVTQPTVLGRTPPRLPKAH